MRVKICGITKPEQGCAIASLGATALGFICVPQSPRYVEALQIQRIVNRLPSKLDLIGVFANATLEEITQILETGALTGIQLHGDESPQFCQQIREKFGALELIKAFRVKNSESLAQIQFYSPYIDTLLLDAYHPHILGGTGQTLDWTNLDRVSLYLPWFLAGGLTPDNIAEALKHLNPNGIDLSSGVERAPGDKDLDKVAMLFEQIKNSHEGANKQLI